MLKLFGEDIEDTIGILLLFAIVIGFFLFLIKTSIDSRKENKRLLEELEKPYEESPITEISVRVLRKYCYVKTYGTKMPESVKEFYVEFLTKNGEELKYKVLEEDYLAITEDSVGTLAIVNDNFYGFQCHY